MVIKYFKNRDDDLMKKREDMIDKLRPTVKKYEDILRLLDDAKNNLKNIKDYVLKLEKNRIVVNLTLKKDLSDKEEKKK